MSCINISYMIKYCVVVWSGIRLGCSSMLRKYEVHFLKKKVTGCEVVVSLFMKKENSVIESR